MPNLLQAVSESLNILGSVLAVIFVLALVPVVLYLGVRRG